LSTAVELHVEEYGAGDPAIVLLHGFAGSARNFRPQARFLRERHRVVLFDARGHARSAAPVDEAEYSPEAFVEDLARVVERTGSKRIVVGGISMGAAIALRYALRYRAQRASEASGGPGGRAQRASEASGGPGGTEGALGTEGPLGTDDRQGGLAGLVLASYPPAGDAFSPSWALALADAIERDGAEVAGERYVWGGGRFDAAAAKWIRQGFLEHRPQALVAVLRRVLAVEPRVSERKKNLSELRVPTLLIAGEQDVRSVETTSELEQLLPNARRVVVPGAGHVLNLEKPQSFNEALRRFLSEIEVAK
jgi:pimeloyl-ACP methyl ester carboxylesterase